MGLYVGRTFYKTFWEHDVDAIRVFVFGIMVQCNNMIQHRETCF